MSRRSWTEAEIARLRADYARIPTRQLAADLGRSFSAVRSRAKNLGLTRGVRQEWSESEIHTLRDRYPHEVTYRIAKDLGRTERQIYAKARLLGLKKSNEFMASPFAGRIRPGANVGGSSRFPKGHVPHNKGKNWSAGGASLKTRFKPGNKPKTWVPVGTETVDVDGYLKRKVSDDYERGESRRGWKYVHRLLWEEHHGEIPDGCAVVFRNGNQTDIRIENLELIHRAELARRNGVARFPAELRALIRTRAVLTRRINQREARREKQD